MAGVGARARAGYGLLVAVGLFAGFPMLGADLGGALTMFVAAGLWWALRTRGRLRWVDLLITGGRWSPGWRPCCSRR